MSLFQICVANVLDPFFSSASSLIMKEKNVPFPIKLFSEERSLLHLIMSFLFVFK